MSSDGSTRAALLEQLRQKRQRGEKNKYETNTEGDPEEEAVEEEREDEDEEKDEKPSRKRAKIVPSKKLDEFAGFSVNKEPEPPVLKEPVVSNKMQASNGSSAGTDPADKPLQFYCLDIYEDFNKKPGDVYLFGKTKLESGEFVNCCARIRSVKRRIFILPRATRIDPQSGNETGATVTMVDVEEELIKEFKRLRIEGFVINKEPKKRKYCLAATVGVPSEANYLEVRYSFTYEKNHEKWNQALPVNFSGATFSHAFGTSSTGLEILLLECRLRLPCWIEIKKTKKSKEPISWCNVEVDVDNLEPSDLRCLTNVTNLPPLNVLSISIKPMPNADNSQKEVVAVGLWFNSSYYLDKDKQDETAWRHLCVIRKGIEHAHLFDFKAKLAKEASMRVKVEENERALLSSVMMEIQKFNPDIIVGHDLWDFELQCLLGRVYDHKGLRVQLPRAGRLRRGVPNHRVFSKYDVYDTMAGRLVCDLKVMAMEFLLRSKSFDLTELALQMLGMERKEIAAEAIRDIYNSSESLIDFIKFTIMDAGFCWRLMAKLCCLQLTSEITRIVGGVWSKTLQGGRAERTEFLLLHAFEAAGHVAPEKFKAKKGFHKVEEIDDDEEHAVAVGGQKKGSYAGGLVLEPKKGLYDNYILLLDFNSLYPSIIMEYNVCFTTIDQRKFLGDNAAIPPIPESGLPQGILPNEVRKLVESRKAVKQLMKDTKMTPERLQELNIRQQALKITANSMYGCLGFSSSRFYAKPLAALITSQGREILMDTKTLVEKMHLEVVYGDTDSIMINTHSEKLEEVLEIGTKVKTEVRKKYRQLELDIDGVYKKLLLYKKKKYAGLMVESPAAALKQAEMKVKREMKGLDIVRRDCPPIAVEAGSCVLDELLSDNETSANLGRIFTYLSKLAESVRNGNIPVEKFEVSKQLSRAPTEYGDKKQPHVMVALRLNANGRHLKQGDVVAYIICENGTSDAAMQRAYHRSEMEANKDLKIDIVYYLSQQVHPVVTRLLEPIKGVDAVKVAECLGLDTSSYRRNIPSANSARDALSVTSIFDDFSGCSPFTFKCLECKSENEITSVFLNREGEIKPSLQRCVNTSCTGTPFQHRAMLWNRLQVMLRQSVKKYHQMWLTCDDCAYRTRRIVLEVGGRGMARCPSCRQFSLHQEYSAQQLYSQLAYFQAIFDWTAAFNKVRAAHKGMHIENDQRVRFVYDELKRSVDGLLTRNAFAQIDLGKLFRSLM